MTLINNACMTLNATLDPFLPIRAPEHHGLVSVVANHKKKVHLHREGEICIRKYTKGVVSVRRLSLSIYISIPSKV